MKIGVGLDPTLGLSVHDEESAAKEAAMLGYESIWTPEGTGQDSYQICMARWMATKQVVAGGLVTGIAVSPVMWRSPTAFAMSGGTMSKITGGKFIMGLGAGGAYQPTVTNAIGLSITSPLRLMRDYMTITKDLVSGNRVEYEGSEASLMGLRLGITPAPKTPLYLGALGPKMLSLAGELADGVALNWCSPDQIEWSKKQIKNGAALSGRDAGDINVTEYIRVCIDEDEETARIALAKATMTYALGPSVPTNRDRRFGYRAHFERMGFANELKELDQMRSLGATNDQIAESFPENILRSVAYFGKPDGAAAEVARLSKGLDRAIVRVVSPRPGSLEATLDAMTACRPCSILNLV